MRRTSIVALAWLALAQPVVALAQAAPGLSTSAFAFASAPASAAAPASLTAPASTITPGRVCVAANSATATAGYAPAYRPPAETSFKMLGQDVIVFGRLWPSTNVAAQAGTLDTAYSAISSHLPQARGYGYERPASRKKVLPRFSRDGCPVR